MNVAADIIAGALITASLVYLGGIEFNSSEFWLTFVAVTLIWGIRNAINHRLGLTNDH